MEWGQSWKSDSLRESDAPRARGRSRVPSLAAASQINLERSESGESWTIQAANNADYRPLKMARQTAHGRLQAQRVAPRAVRSWPSVARRKRDLPRQWNSRLSAAVLRRPARDVWRLGRPTVLPPRGCPAGALRQHLDCARPSREVQEAWRRSSCR